MAERLNVPVECALDVRNIVGESPVWSAREMLVHTPQAGGLFMLQPGVAGTPVGLYQGSQ